MTEKLQMNAVVLCPYCSSTRRHHWPDDCISHLHGEIAALREQLAAEARVEPLAKCINAPACSLARYN